MRKNTAPVSGVMNAGQSAQHYDLQRYVPEPALAGFIEQFWSVVWDFPPGKTHIQRNLPDLNWHLIFSGSRPEMLSPVQTAYAYPMTGTGRIIAVKFAVGALSPLIAGPPSHYLGQSFPVDRIFGAGAGLSLPDAGTGGDIHRVFDHLALWLQTYADRMPTDLAVFQALVAQIKADPGVTKVDQLPAITGMSVRTVQRYFQRYLGVSPKWFIRRCRLQRAIDLLGSVGQAGADIAAHLGYADQAHFIKDFGDMIGLTPGETRSLAR